MTPKVLQGIGIGEDHLTLDCQSFFIIKPDAENVLSIDYKENYKQFNPTKVEVNFTYTSEHNELISNTELKKCISEYVFSS